MFTKKKKGDNQFEEAASIDTMIYFNYMKDKLEFLSKKRL